MDNFILPPLYAIANVDRTGDPLEYIEELLRAGITLLQIRAKTFDDVALLHVVKETLKISSQLGSQRPAQIIVNDRADICRLAGAHGVHMGIDDFTPEARTLLGSDAVIGISTHNTDDIARANDLEANYLGFGPVFESATKSGHAPVVGIDGLIKAINLSKKPLVAIGGINLERASLLYRAGVKSVAVIQDLQNNREKLQLRILGYYAQYKAARALSS